MTLTMTYPSFESFKCTYLFTYHRREKIDFSPIVCSGSVRSYIVVHIGGNDLGETRLGLLHYKLKRFMMWLSHKMPLTQLIYSQILPRTYWRYSSDNNKIDKCRRRLNSSIGSLMVKDGGYYIHYPDIRKTAQFISADGVHLTALGNGIFLNTLQGALEKFVCCKGGVAFP